MDVADVDPDGPHRLEVVVQRVQDGRALGEEVAEQRHGGQPHRVDEHDVVRGADLDQGRGAVVAGGVGALDVGADDGFVDAGEGRREVVGVIDERELHRGPWDPATGRLVRPCAGAPEPGGRGQG